MILLLQGQDQDFNFSFRLEWEFFDIYFQIKIKKIIAK